ncbi:MAG: tRNA/rRNA cytosine-C5-methylase [Candidatus Nanopelagicaceae bacterium]|nr:tRNA/rRNA cytosine-C5-methylase [Candidatus Nanopelagicaceae bacterium]
MRVISDARLLAFEALIEVEESGAYSNLLLPKLLSKSDLPKVDKAFAAELVYGSLRLKARHDLYISKASTRSLEDIDTKVLIALRLGVHQLKEMRVPSHAAINETVELAKRVAGKSTGGFVNALLRKIDDFSMEDLALPTDMQARLAAEYSHPEWIVSSYFDSLKNQVEVERLLRANNLPARPTLIAWPGRSTQNELVEAGANVIEGSVVAASYDGDPGDIDAIRERRAGVQDLGSQIVVEKFLRTYQPGLRWLDLCAGPGGKAAYLSSYINLHEGEFIANEISSERAKLVTQVVEKSEVINHDGRNLPSEIGSFDRILIDAPCTGIGALRRRPEVRWRRTLQDLKNLTTLQSELMDAAALHLKSEGVLAYVTCSSHQAETKFQIRSFLKRNAEFTRVPIEDSRSDEDGELQLWPHRDNCDAMFLSMLQKG